MSALGSGVLLKRRQQTSMIEGWWAKYFHQAANVYERGLLQATASAVIRSGSGTLAAGPWQFQSARASGSLRI